MITVDCHDVESIQNELLIYVADNVAAIPNIKYHEFILSPIEEEDEIDRNEVVTAIKEFLESIHEQRNFAVISKGDVISIESIRGKIIERDAKPSTSGLFSCPHCGFMTQYEVEYNTHKKIHYF
tara:strand:- start:1373 stop:1744 length:372 start_codon:yes stop_codon:yes gene_type:complete